jgi:hypothetical protein
MMDELKEKIAIAVFDLPGYPTNLAIAQAALTAIEEAGYVVVPEIKMHPDDSQALLEAVSKPPAPNESLRKLFGPVRRWKDGERLWAENDFATVVSVATDDPAKLTGWRLGLHGPDQMCVGYITREEAKAWEPSYATLSDSATAFDPEKQFEADREGEAK